MMRSGSCTGAIARDCERRSIALFTRRPNLMMFYRKFFFRFGRRPVVTHQRQASHLDGWLPSPAGGRSTDCAGARLIVAPGTVMKNESCRIHKLPGVMLLKHSFRSEEHTSELQSH